MSRAEFKRWMDERDELGKQPMSPNGPIYKRWMELNTLIARAEISYNEQEAELAFAEGWCVTNDSDDNMVVAKRDGDEDYEAIFESDEDAFAHVIAKVQDGDRTAIAAIRYICLSEYRAEEWWINQHHNN